MNGVVDYVSQFECFVAESVLLLFELRQFLGPPPAFEGTGASFFQVVFQNFPDDLDQLIYLEDKVLF